MKSKTSLFVIGILIAMLAASLLTGLILFLTGSIATNGIELVFTMHAVEAKEYDGTPLRADGYDWDSGELKEGHHLEVWVLGSQTNRGTSESDLLVKAIDEEGRDVTDDYKIKVNKGELTVTKRTVTVLLRAQQIPYSGKEIELEKFDLYKGNGLAGPIANFEKEELPEGQKLVVSFPGKFENAGDKLPDISEWQYENFKVYDAAGNDVTYNYSMDCGLVGNGDIEIVPRRLKIKVSDAEKYFDGTPLVPQYEIISGSLAEGQFIGEVEYVDESGKQVSVIKSEDSTNVKVSKITVFTQDGFDLIPIVNADKNYILEGGAEVFGKLTVNKRLVTVAAKDLVKEYDGYPLSDCIGSGEKPYVTDLPEGFTLTALTDFNFNIANVYDGSFEYESFIVKDEFETVVTDQFKFAAKSGTAKITPIVIRSGLNALANQTYSGNEFVLTQSALDNVLEQNIEAYIDSRAKLSNTVQSGLRMLYTDCENYFRTVSSEIVKNAGKYRYTVELIEEKSAQVFGNGNVIFEFSTAEFEVEKAAMTAYYQGTSTPNPDGTPNPDTAVNTVTKTYDGNEANLDFRNLVLSGENCVATSAVFLYTDPGSHAFARDQEYTVSVMDIHVFNTETLEDVTNNYSIPDFTVAVKINKRSVYVTVGQSFMSYEVDFEPTESDGENIGMELEMQFKASVSVQGLANGDYISYDDVNVFSTYYSDERKIIFTVLVNTIYDSYGNDVTENCYSIENTGDLITVQIVVKGE